MEVRNLVTFLKVTELKSFSRAAEALDYSQSAVTVQIQQLERELGVQLFDRIGKTVSITQYGKDFVSYARDVVSAIARASAFASSDSELSGTVRVGTLNSLLTASFSNIVPLYHERFRTCRSACTRAISPPSPKCSSRMSSTSSTRSMSRSSTRSLSKSLKRRRTSSS